jgi:manganese efflux pump family protein
MPAVALICGGLPLGVALAAGLAVPPADAAPAAASAPASGAAILTAADAGGSVRACEDYARAAIERHQAATAKPSACRGLSRAEVSQAASAAIRMTETRGSKPVLRREAIAAARWVRAMLAGPVAAAGPVASAAPASQSATSQSATSQSASSPVGGPGLGGVSELAAKAGALLAWLATAASGGFVLARWLLAGGSPLRRTVTAAPPAVILGHVGAGALGLVLWVSFMLSGWVPLAWTALAVLAPVAGLGMGVLLLGLPGPVRPRIEGRAVGARATGRRARIPVLVIAGHGMFAVTTLLLVLMATIGAG